MATMISKVIALLIVMQVRFGRGYDNIIFEYLRLPEGSHCSWRGVDGVCASVYQCMSAMKDIGEKDYPPICSFQGVKPIICCTDCELRNLTLNPHIFLNPGVDVRFYKTGEKARDYCLDTIEMQGPRCQPHGIATFDRKKHPTRNCYIVEWGEVGVAGGIDALRNQYRHMALLGYGADIDSAQWLCGGSLISNKFILTAGHCSSAPKVGPVRYVTLGILKRSDPLELWQRYHVKRIVRHPQYRPPSKYHDIALLETTKRVTFNIHVLPACLQFTSNANDFAASATGWGALGRNRELADTLQSVYLQRFGKHECDRLYRRHRHLRHGVHHDTQTCYGHRYKVGDTCEGDSGGPLQSNGYLSECAFTIMGVTSMGRTCGLPGNPGIYTRVMPYLPWIESIVWPD